MKINVGSTNPNKIEAVRDLITEYPIFKDAEVIGIQVESSVNEQSLSLDETLRGALHRAKAAFDNCEYSVGIETGLMKVPYTKTGYMNVLVCVLYDGKETYIGLSSPYEYPQKIIDLLLKEKMTIQEAFNTAKLTDNPKFGLAEGAIGVLTKGRVNRIEYTKQAIRMALIQLENSFY